MIKNIEVMGKKKSPVTDLESILSGAAFGAALGAKVGQGGFGNKKEIHNNIENDIIDVSQEELIIETEHLGGSSDLSRLLDGE